MNKLAEKTKGWRDVQIERHKVKTEDKCSLHRAQASVLFLTVPSPVSVV